MLQQTKHSKHSLAVWKMVKEWDFSRLDHEVPGNLEMEKHCSSVPGDQEMSAPFPTQIGNDLFLNAGT
jgi:hypothetical protein